MKKFTAKAAALAVAALIGSQLNLPKIDFNSISADWAKTAVNMIIDAVAPQSSNAKEHRPSFGAAETKRVSGYVTSIPDGDTISVKAADGSKYRVRFLGIDTPESKQLHGPESQRTLERMIRDAGNRVDLVFQKEDRYGRIVAFVYAGGKNLNYEQIKNGSAWYYRQYQKDLKAIDPSAPAKFDEAERNARRSRLGLWKDSNPQEPWEWRKQHPRHN
jgi:endonuclease YncB( thermonuclease family)